MSDHGATEARYEATVSRAKSGLESSDDRTKNDRDIKDPVDNTAQMYD